MSSQQTDEAGRVLAGIYRLGRRLGSGGMGTVYAAVDERTSRRCAVKLLDQLQADLDGDDEALARFQGDARAAAALHRDGIVAVHEIDRAEDGTVFVVMDLLEGEPLDERLRRDGSPGLAQTRAVFASLADALSAAHEAGIVHHDLKPANVFLRRTSDGERAVLLDFGLAKHLVESSATPAYISPEQARGGDVEVRSDVYSLAVILFELLCGCPPYEGSTTKAILARVLSEPVPRVSTRSKHEIPAAVDEVLLAALDKEPSRRPGSVQAFAIAIEAAFEGRGTALGQSADETVRALVVASPPEEPSPETLQIAATGASRRWARRLLPWLGLAAVLAFGVWMWWMQP